MMNNIMDIIKAAMPNILVFVVILIGGYRTYLSYSKMNKEEKVEAALKVIKTELLKLMSDAEIEWEDFKKSGDLKKSQVLREIYTQFPFLATYIDQDTLIQKIYEMIDEEMDNMNKIINNTGTKTDTHSTDNSLEDKK